VYSGKEKSHREHPPLSLERLGPLHWRGMWASLYSSLLDVVPFLTIVR